MSLTHTYVDLLTGEPIMCTAVNSSVRGELNTNLGQAFQDLLDGFEVRYPIDFTRVRNHDGPNPLLNAIACINSRAQWNRLDSHFAAILEVVLVTRPRAAGTDLSCAEALSDIRREAATRPNNQSYRMWRLITVTFTLDTSKELQRIRQRTMTLPCDHTRRLSTYIRALLSGLRSHSLVDCSDPSLRLLPANSLSSKDLTLNVLNMATALVSMDCGLNTSVIFDYRECCLNVHSSLS